MTGFIYVDTFSLVVTTGDEVVSIPYSYTVTKVGSSSCPPALLHRSAGAGSPRAKAMASCSVGNIRPAPTATVMP